MVPNLITVVQQVRASKTWPFRSKEQLCAYTQAVIKALHTTDPNFGNLLKVPAQNHCIDSLGRLHATDVALYKPTGQIVDFISSAGFEPDLNLPEPPNAVSWGVGHEGEYGPERWFAPVDGTDPGPGPVDPPTPPIDPQLVQRIIALEDYVSGLKFDMSNLKSEVVANKNRMESINTRFDNESKENVKKPLPDYVGTIRIFGFNFTLISRPR